MTQAGVEKLTPTVFKAIICDITKQEDVDKLSSEVDAAISSHSNLRMWCLLNNAGIAQIGYGDWLPMEVFRKVMDVNYFGLISVTKALLPYLKKTKDSRIINLSSMAGLLGGPGFGAYAGSKHAVEGVTKSVDVNY